MIETPFVDVCGGEKRMMCRNAEGMLFQREAEQWKEFPFNALYHSYYEPCSFTALGYYRERFYAAGVDSANCTHLFSSQTGSVWTEQNLTDASPTGEQTRLRGAATKMLCAPDQLYLLTDAKQLASIPDCPKCVSIRPLEDIPVDGWIDGQFLHVKWKSGGEKTIALNMVTQFRVSWSYGAELIQKHTATVVDLRLPAEYEKGHIPASVSLPLEDVEDWLETQDKNAYLLFLCKYGVQADNSVRYARRAGFVHAYSLGGTEPFAHLL